MPFARASLLVHRTFNRLGLALTRLKSSRSFPWKEGDPHVQWREGISSPPPEDQAEKEKAEKAAAEVGEKVAKGKPLMIVQGLHRGGRPGFSFADPRPHMTVLPLNSDKFHLVQNEEGEFDVNASVESFDEHKKEMEKAKMEKKMEEKEEKKKGEGN